MGFISPYNQQMVLKAFAFGVVSFRSDTLLWTAKGRQQSKGGRNIQHKLIGRRKKTKNVKYDLVVFLFAILLQYNANENLQQAL
jgi:hypothetical protein